MVRGAGVMRAFSMEEHWPAFQPFPHGGSYPTHSFELARLSSQLGELAPRVGALTTISTLSVRKTKTPRRQ